MKDPRRWLVQPICVWRAVAGHSTPLLVKQVKKLEITDLSAIASHKACIASIVDKFFRLSRGEEVFVVFLSWVCLVAEG